jgi:hypothetical protein
MCVCVCMSDTRMYASHMVILHGLGLYFSHLNIIFELSGEYREYCVGT